MRVRRVALFKNNATVKWAGLVLYIESVTEGDKQRGDTLNPGRKKY